jgi:hypothetical protein
VNEVIARAVYLLGNSELLRLKQVALPGVSQMSLEGNRVTTSAIGSCGHRKTHRVGDGVSRSHTSRQRDELDVDVVVNEKEEAETPELCFIQIVVQEHSTLESRATFLLD